MFTQLCIASYWRILSCDGGKSATCVKAGFMNSYKKIDCFSYVSLNKNYNAVIYTCGTLKSRFPTSTEKCELSGKRPTV